MHLTALMLQLACHQLLVSISACFKLPYVLQLGKHHSGDALQVVALITIEVHARDVIDKLSKAGVTSPAAFEWSSQLRFYWDQDNNDCFVKQVSLFQASLIPPLSPALQIGTSRRRNKLLRTEGQDVITWFLQEGQCCKLARHQGPARLFG